MKFLKYKYHFYTKIILGYTQYLWTLLPMGLTKVVIWSVWIVSGGKYDLTEFFERLFLILRDSFKKSLFCFSITSNPVKYA
jgi:hypothetical protein